MNDLLNAPPRKRKIFVIDDHITLRTGLVRIINNELDLTVCGEANTALEALQSIGPLAPDLVMLETSLQDGDGMQLLQQIVLQWPKLSVLILSMHEASTYAHRALRAGARGYVMKLEPAQDVLAAIRAVLAGEVHISDTKPSSDHPA